MRCMVLHGVNGTTRNHDLVLRGSPSDGFYLHDRVTGTLVGRLAHRCTAPQCPYASAIALSHDRLPTLERLL